MDEFDMRVEQQVKQLHNRLIMNKTIEPTHVLAAFVIETVDNPIPYVASIGTGTNWIAHKSLTNDGLTVFDSHAEIIARRAFKSYLYQKLRRYTPTSEDSIFCTSDASEGKLTLKNKYRIHLYISASPCGCASSYRKHNITATLLTRKECSSGVCSTDSEISVKHRRWDYVTQQGQRNLRTMTCSDKLCQWNVVGVQGALLSHFLDPIYLTSVIIGTNWIAHKSLTNDGLTVFDSHAEIIARRAFKSYLYQKLRRYTPTSEDSIFCTSDASEGKLTLKNKYRIHLYISASPCGCASSYRKHNIIATLLTRKECSSGVCSTDSEISVKHRRWDYVTQQGQRNLRTMTCSDKLCQWNVVGVQGALLSHFLDPIYLTSVIIGTNWIAHKSLTNDGLTVFDSHAEIIARRAFKSYLYQKLRRYTPTSEDSIFCTSDASEGKLTLKNKYRIHLYISASPCGCASSYRKHNIIATLLTRKECSSGVCSTDSEISVKHRRWDYVTQQGQRNLRTMTCSDKLCQWNVVGVQGALLSHFLDPIYLTSVIIGSNFRTDRVQLALNRRLQSFTPENYNLPVPYRVSCPSVKGREKQNVINGNKTSLNWFAEMGDQVEINNGFEGRDIVQQTSSRLCKKEFFNAFEEVCRLGFFNWERLLDGNPTYLELKEGASSYKQAKTALTNYFRDSGLGHWVRKPSEVDVFRMRRYWLRTRKRKRTMTV